MYTFAHQPDIALNQLSISLLNCYRGNDCIAGEVGDRGHNIEDLLSLPTVKIRCAVSLQTDFRFYWLKERLDEVPAVCEKSSINPVSAFIDRNF